MIEREKQETGRIVYSCTGDGKTLRNILEEELNMSSRFMSKLKKTKNIYVNGKFKKFDYRVSSGDIVDIVMEEEESGFDAQEIAVSVKYEDFDMVVVDKPPFMVVHPTKSHDRGTVANALANYFQSKGDQIRIRFVNRLDMNTSGLVMIAKNPYAHHIISEEMKSNNVVKKYRTIVKGVVKDDEGSIDVPIYRPTEDSIMRTADPRGQRALTHYNVMERYEDASLLEVRIETGRTHQIRVHMKHIGHPIIGDELYGEADENLIGRQALHAYSLEFSQPRTKEKANVSADIPQDMKDLIQKLKKRGG